MLESKYPFLEILAVHVPPPPQPTNVAGVWRDYSISNGATRHRDIDSSRSILLIPLPEARTSTCPLPIGYPLAAPAKALVRFIFVCPLLFEYPLSGLSHIFGTERSGEAQVKRKPPTYHIPIRRVTPFSSLGIPICALPVHGMLLQA
jgi:hypothetical protein